MGPRPAGRADPRGRRQGGLAHQAQHPTLGGADAGDAQPRPDLAMTLAMEGAVLENPADFLDQAGIRDRPSRPRATERHGQRRHAVPVDRGARHTPDPADEGDALGFAAARRGHAAHGLDLSSAKERPASRAAILASRNSPRRPADPSDPSPCQTPPAVTHRLRDVSIDGGAGEHRRGSSPAACSGRIECGGEWRRGTSVAESVQ